MKTNLKIVFVAIIGVISWSYYCRISAGEDAADLHQKGITALKDSQTNPDAIVTAARYFAKASAQYEASGKTELAVEMNSYLYWCKKRMSLKDIDAFLKSEEPTVAAQFTAVEKKTVDPGNAQSFMDRADVFARGNPNEHFLIAVRYFEIAGRFKGTEVSLAAQEKSLQEIQLAMSGRAAPNKDEVPTRPTGLSWLVSQQETDGHWDAKKHSAEHENDTAVTSLALLALLGAGHSEGAGEYSVSVQRAVSWLRTKALSQHQKGTPGDQPFGDGYGPPLMALALAEATASGSNGETRVAAQKAVDYCTRTFPITSGENNSARVAATASTPIVGWCAIAMKSAKAAGIRVEPTAFAAASEFLDAVEHVPAGSFWNKPDEKLVLGQSPQALSAVGATGRLFLGKKRDDVRPITDYFRKIGGAPAWNDDGGTVDLCYWYFGSLAIFQTDPAGFRDWSDAIANALTKRQQSNGEFGGNRNREGFVRREWGRVGQTALACMCLEVRAQYQQLHPTPIRTTINLLELVDPRKNKVVGKGKWQIFGDHLCSDNGVRGFVQIPYHPPDEYDFNVEFSMQKSRFVLFVLPAAHTQFELEIGSNNTTAGFEMVSGKRADSNETTRPFTIEANRRYKVVVKVRKNGASAYIDDQLISELKTDFTNLSLHPHWVIPDKRAFAVTNDLVVATYFSISVTEITGHGEVIQSKP